MTKKSDLKRTIIHDIKEMRYILNSVEERARTNNPYQMALAATFFHILKYHIQEGDLTPESIDLALNLKHQEFLRQSGE